MPPPRPHPWGTNSHSVSANEAPDLLSAKFWVLQTLPYDCFLNLLPDLLRILHPVTVARSVEVEIMTGLALATVTLRNGLSSQIPSMRHAQSFFSIVSLSTFIPSIASAYIFLSSAFSFSSAYRRLASVSSIWPYFFRQRWSVAMEICFCRQNASWFKSLLSQSRSNRIISSGLCLFCFISRIWFIQILSLVLGQFSRRRSLAIEPTRKRANQKL